MIEAFSLELELFFQDSLHAKIIRDSLEPEWGYQRRTRSQTKIKVKKGILLINIKAADITALKASINSFLKPVILSKKLIKGRC